MKYILLALTVIFLFGGCAKKIVVKKPQNTIQMQKEDANRAWRELDN